MAAPAAASAAGTGEAEAPAGSGSKPELRWGIIGCGDVCEVKAGPGLYKNPRSVLHAVMRRDGAKAKDFASRHGVRTSYDAADALLKDPEVDAVYIATPPSTHLELALAAAAAGKPCLLEKPMAMNAAECAKICAAFGDAGLPLYVAYYRRGHPKHHWLRKFLADGGLGTVTELHYVFRKPQKPDILAASSAAELPWRVRCDLSAGGEMVDVGSHAIDIFAFILGAELQDVAGSAVNAATPTMDVEDSAVMTFRSGAVLGSARWNFAADTANELLTIVGTKGRLTTTVLAPEPVTVTIAGEVEPRVFTFDGIAHQHQPLQAMVTRAILDGEDAVDDAATPMPTGARAAAATACIDAVLGAYYGGRSDEFWKRGPWPGSPTA